MVNIDMSLLVQMINFIVLIFILNALLFKPIRGMLKTRKEKMERMGEDIEGFSNESSEKAAAFTDGLKEARARGMKEKEALVQEAVAEEKKIIGEINEKAQAELEKVRKTVEKDVDNVRVSLMKQVDAFAGEIGQKILGRAV